MATPKKAPEELQRRGRKPRDPSGRGKQVYATIPAPHEQELVSRYGSASVGIVEAVRRLIEAK